MTNRPILLLLQTPPPFGGGEIRAGWVARVFSGCPGYVVHEFQRTRSTKASQGRLTQDNLLRGAEMIRESVRLLREHRPALVYLGLPKNFSAFLRAAMVIRAAKQMGIRVYGDLAGARFTFLRQPLLRSVGLHYLRQVDGIRALGQGVREELAAHGLTRCTVFSNGVELPAGIDVTPYAGETLNLLYMGALNRTKGLKTILQALLLCHQNGLSVRCNLCGQWGDPTLREEILSFIRHQRLEPLARFPGLVIGDLKWEMYRQSTLLLHPTTWDGQPLSILEAMGMGLAVISTRVGAIPETVIHERNGLILDRATPVALYEAILRLYSDQKLRFRIRRQNREDFLARFSLDVYLRNLRGWLERERDAAGEGVAP